jgi:Ca2+-binding RTX toxin-like protein
MAKRNGSAVQDTLSGTGGSDTISGGGGGDLLKGGSGDDVIYGHGAGDGDPNAGAIDAIRVATGLDRPVFAQAAPGDADHLFVIEQRTGKIQTVDIHTGAVSATPFLDIPNSDISTAGEQGLLGLAFAPDYATTGRLYVNVTNALGDTEVWEYQRSLSDPSVADPASKRLILTFDQPFTNHNGGWIGFGPDGYLYISTGDGGGPGDPNNTAQNLGLMLGKILRIDVNGDDFAADPARNYAVPSDNPFVGVSGAAPEVWHYGLRNPFRMSFDSATGDMYIGDVGWTTREEVDYVRAGVGGLNFGWSIREGTVPYRGPDDPSYTSPVLDYAHDATPYGGRAVIGGYVYHGEGGAQGLYFFADEVDGHIFTTRVVNGVAQDFANRDDQIRENIGTIGNITSFAIDAAGALYTLDLQGQLYRLDPSAAADDARDRLYGGAGNDTLYGGASEDYLHGGPGNDRLFGGGGDDTLVTGGWTASDAGFGIDVMDGGEGSDTLSLRDTPFGATIGLGVTGPQGPAGSQVTLVSIENILGWDFNDTLSGDAGPNTLAGGKGDDVLAGGKGNDRLIGGLGADTMNGGAGIDTFVYTDNRESRGNAIDLIVGFHSNSDRIDLSAIDANRSAAGDQAFALVAALDGHAGQLALVYDPQNDITLVRGDVNGDSIPDFVIRIQGDHTDFSGFIF